METASGARPSDRRQGNNWGDARKLAISLLRHKESLADDTLMRAAAYQIRDIWGRKKLHGKVSNKTALLAAKAKDLEKDLIEGKVTAQEFYQKMGELLYPEKFSKHSKQGEVDTRIDNIVEEKDLTPAQKLLKSFGEKLGVKTVFFSNKDGNFHGAHAGNTSYINVNSKMPHGKVFWHESSHWLKNNNSDLFDEFAKAAQLAASC